MKYTIRTLLVVATALLWTSPRLFAQIYSPPPPGAFAKGFDTAGDRTVASATVGTAGTGYTSLPTIAFTGGNGATQATGTVLLKGVTAAVVAGGSGWTTGQVATLAAGNGTGTASTWTVTASAGAVTSVAVLSGGSYTVPNTTTGTTTTGTGSGLTLTVAYGVGSIVITNPGTGYHTTVPTIAFTGGGGSSGAATAVFAAQAAKVYQFDGFIPLEDTVLAAYTPFANGDYASTNRMIGKTFHKGVYYPVAGNSVTPASGYLLLAKASNR